MRVRKQKKLTWGEQVQRIQRSMSSWMADEMETIKDWIAAQTEAAQRCRECDNVVSLSDDYCPHCGATSPARVSGSATFVVFTVVAVTIIVAMWLWA